MIGIEIIKYSLKHLWNRKSRSMLTIFSIFIGITTIFIFISFGLGLFNYFGELTSGSSADKVIIQPRGTGAPGLDTTFQLTDKDLKVIEKTSGVYEASGAYFKVAEVKQKKETKYTFVVAYDPDKPLIMEIYNNIGVDNGRWLKKSDRGKVLLGYNYQFKNKIFSKPYEVGKKINVQGKDLSIVGFLESIGNPQDDAQIYLINDYIDDLFPNETNSYGWITARVDTEEIDKVIFNIEKNLRKHRDLDVGKEDFFVQSFDDIIESFANVLNILIGFIIMIALISVFVSAVNTSNTMITSVLERVKEIGVMKAIGAKNSEIFNMFLFESGLLGLISGTIGVIVGYILTDFAGNTLERLGWGFLSPFYSWELFAGCILFATLTGAISGVIPAIKASKTNVVDALRYE